VGSPYFTPASSVPHRFDDFVVTLARHDHPRRDRAALTRMRDHRESAGHCGHADVSVVEQHKRPTCRRARGNTRFTVALAAAHDLTPDRRRSVNETTSTSGCVVKSAPAALPDSVRTLTTPRGMSVFSAINRPIASVAHGVWGGPFENDGAARSERGRSFASASWIG
jgi:hypothetical protein